MPKKTGAHTIHKLTVLGVDRVKTPGVYADGGNLYLQVEDSGCKSWLFRYMLDGRQRKMGLGPVRDVSLEKARDVARAARDQLRQGLDPLEVRRVDRAAMLASQATVAPTFKWCAETFITTVKEPELKNAKHAAQWGSTLAAYVYPVLGERPVDSITVHDVQGVLAPIWLTINETASRVRGRIEKVLAWAEVKGYRKGDNPAAWKNRLEMLLAAPNKVQADEHYAALPFALVPAFIAELHGIQVVNRKYRRSIAPSMALEFAILTAQRTNPIITATWDEIDLKHRVWESPASKMKLPHPHRTPLCDRAVEILEQMRQVKGDSEIVFQWHGTALHNTSLLNVVENMDERKPGVWVDPKQDNRRVTPHGFRSAFMDWAHEGHEFDAKALDLALAHSKGDMTEAAYRRADMLVKRRPIMDAWAAFCMG